MILGPAPPFSRSMSPWRATATHFGPKTVISRPPQNANICYRTPKNLILGLCMYCKQGNLHCRYKYMPRRYRLYAPKIKIICFKDTNCILQIHNLYVVRTEFLCWKYTHCLSLRQRFLCITYTESVFLCVTYTEYVLSKLGATKCAPAGFFPTKNTPSDFYK